MYKNGDNKVLARQSFENQIRLAEDLKKFLYELQERLSLAAQSYQQKCNTLYELGMMEETLNELLLEYMPSTTEQIMNIVAKINECDIPFIRRYIAEFDQFLPPIRDDYGNIVNRRRGNRILDIFGDWKYEIRGDRIYDDSGNWIYEFRGTNRIYDTNGNWVYEIRGDRIYDTAGNWLGKEY